MSLPRRVASTVDVPFAVLRDWASFPDTVMVDDF